MKSLEDLNYYEILQIPENASSRKIKQAYDDAVSMYNEDSLATYSLFPNDDRDAILLCIENAYSTLIDENKRAAYDSELIASGRLADPVLPEDPQNMLPVSHLPVCESDACQKEIFDTIDNYANKLELQKFDRQGIRNRLKFLRIQEKIHTKGSLTEVGPELQAMLVDIEKTSIRWRRNISIIILLYTLLAITSFILLATTNAFMLPGFNIPYTVLLMGLVGCIASMYLKLPNIRAEKPLRYDPTIWFIICPPIAVVLAGISYGILQIVFSFIPIDQPDDSWLFRVLAFFVGFVNWVYIYDRLKGEPANRGHSEQKNPSEIARPDDF